MRKDEQYTKFIRIIILFLVQEIQKLHKENDDIIAKIDLVVNKL